MFISHRCGGQNFRLVRTVQGPDPLQPVYVPRAQLDRTVLQQDQAEKLAANYLAFVKLASIRICANW